MLWVNRRTRVALRSSQASSTSSGSYDARVPAGVYDLVVTRGPEYRVYRGKVEVKAGSRQRARRALDRYADLPAAGWFSGESHVHLMRDRPMTCDVWGQLAAEDLHVSNICWRWGTSRGTHFKQPAWGRAGHFGRDGLFPRVRPGRSANRSCAATRFTGTRASHAHSQEVVLPVPLRVRADARARRHHRLRAPRRAVQRPARPRARTCRSASSSSSRCCRAAV